MNVIVFLLAFITLTSIADNHPEDVTLIDSSKKDRTLEAKRQKYKELLLENKTFCELVKQKQHQRIKLFQDNVNRRNSSGKLQTCFSFNEVIYAMQ